MSGIFACAKNQNFTPTQKAVKLNGFDLVAAIAAVALLTIATLSTLGIAPFANPIVSYATFGGVGFVALTTLVYKVIAAIKLKCERTPIASLDVTGDFK